MVVTDNRSAWLIDSSIYVFKAWYRWPEKNDIEGNPINAVYGFLNFSYQLLSTEKPELIAFAFDESLKTSYRKEIYPKYKANRTATPESLQLQFSYCRRFLRAFGIHEAATPYYEADDLIGTWAKLFQEQEISVNIITADKDLAQLIHKNDYYWEYDQGQRLDYKAISRKFRVKPHQIAEQLAIAGDKSDNIPGVPGIGMSTAGKLLKRYGTIDNLFASADDISKMQIRGATRIQELIKEYKATIRLAKKLTTIQCNIDDKKIHHFKISELNQPAINSLFSQFDFPEELRKKWIKLHNQLTLQLPA